MKRTLGELQSMLKGAEPEMNKKAKENVLLIKGPKAHKGKPKRKKAKKQKKKSSSVALSGGVQKNQVLKGKGGCGMLQHVRTLEAELQGIPCRGAEEEKFYSKHFRYLCY